MPGSKWTPAAFGFQFKHDVNPYPSDAPWPSMRHDTRNSGTMADLAWRPLDGATKEVRHFRSGNAIFSTPVIGAGDVIYVGSADRRFYAIDPHAGKELWHKEIAGIIDSAACIGKDGTIFVPAGDGQIHAYTRDGTETWHYDALHDRQKHQFSLSSNFWFEANIVFGPDGALYAANDDFFVYKMTPDHGELIWGYRTGFLIWSACGFGHDGTVYVAGFDHVFLAIDSTTGKKRWARDLHAAMVASPCIAPDGTIFQAAFDGNVYAMDGAKGTFKWVYPTGSHIYASPAIAPGGETVYVGSTSGTFHAIEASSGKTRWMFYVGNTIRSSAALGPDPEKIAPYLVYLGGGDGRVYALDPAGNVRWSYNTLVKAVTTDYPNINASIALGHSGIAVASSTGDIIWIPYDAYLSRSSSVEGMQRHAVLESTEIGARWHYITPGGRLSTGPIQRPQDIHPVNTISIRLLVHGDDQRITPAKLVPGSIHVTPSPGFKHSFEIQSNGTTINIIPEEILEPSRDYMLSITAMFKQDGGGTTRVSSQLPFKTSSTTHDASPCFMKGKTCKIVHMAIPQPSIVPSLNQIGFASLEIPFTIIDHDPTTHKFIAWAVQQFGDEGVPQKRVTTYAFSGQYRGEFFMMDARQCLFEITSFNIPLDVFRIAGSISPEATNVQGGSLLVEKHFGKSMLKFLGEMGSTSPITASLLFKHMKAVGFVEFMKAFRPFLAALFHQLTRNLFKTWGLTNHRDHFIGAGTFKLASFEMDKVDSLNSIALHEFKSNKRTKVMAELSGVPKTGGWDPVARIILADPATMEVLPINYSKYNKQAARDGRIQVVLSIPKKAIEGHARIKAYLLVSLHLVNVIEI